MDMWRRVLFLCCVFWVTFCRGDIFTHQSKQLNYGTPVVERVLGMFAPSDAPAMSPGHGRSYIKLELDFQSMDNSHRDGMVEVAIVRADSTHDIGFTEDGRDRPVYCCDERLLSLGVPGCTQERLNRLIINASPEDYESYPILFRTPPAPRITNLDVRFQVVETGNHVLLISHCDGSLPSVVKFEGRSEWMNPYGYLPGRLWGYLSFYSVMSFVFLGAAFVWFLLHVHYWKDILAVQSAITFVLFLCMAEAMTWYFDYRNFNITGVRNIGPVVWAVLLGVVRKAVSRLLVVSVALGWGIVKPTLGKHGSNLIFLGVLYFVFETALELTIRYAQTNEVGQHWKHMLSLPVGILNAIFYWWVLSSLAKLNLRLEEKKQLVKLKLYNQLTQVLLVSLGFSVFFALYEMYTSAAGDTAQMHWRHLWFLDAGFPTIMYTIILISLSFLLRPTKNHRRFAYTDLKRSQMMKQDSEYGMSELHELNSAGRDSSAYNGHVASQDDLEMPAAPRFTIDDEDCLSDDAGVGKGE